MKIVASGYGLVEAPRSNATGQVYFSDVINGGVYRWAPDGKVETIIPKRRGVGGIVLHQDGGIVITGKAVIHHSQNQTRTLLMLDGVLGYNDITTDSLGRVYVGTLRSSSLEMNARIPGEVWRIEGESQSTQVYGDISFANGIGFSPDGHTLYQSNYDAGVILAHDLDSNGQGVNRRIFATVPKGNPDGLAVDEAGNVWVALASGGGIARFQADGKMQEIIDVPALFVASLCFGGEDQRDLYIATASNTVVPEQGGALFHTRSDISGLIVPVARI